MKAVIDMSYVYDRIEDAESTTLGAWQELVKLPDSVSHDGEYCDWIDDHISELYDLSNRMLHVLGLLPVF